MSEMKRDTGRLYPIEINEAILREKYPKVVERYLDDYDFSQISEIREFLMDTFDNGEIPDEIVELNGKFYLVKDHFSPDYDEYYCHIIKNEDGSIDFDTHYYSGATYWVEMVENKLKSDE